VWSFGGVAPVVGLDMAVVRVFVVVRRCSTRAGSLRGSGKVVCGHSVV